MKKAILIPVVLTMMMQHATFADWGGYDRDSLRAIVFDYSLPDSTRLYTATMFINNYIFEEPDSLLYYTRLFYKESVKADFIPGMVYFTVAEGWHHAMHGKKNEALKYYLAGLKPAEEHGKPLLRAFVYKEIGGGYMELYMMDKASDYMLRAIKIYREVNDQWDEIVTLGNLASVYALSGHKQRAIDVCLRVITLVDSLKLEDMSDKGVALDRLGTLYKETGKPQEAIQCYQEALKIYQQCNYPGFYQNTLFNLALFFLDDTLNLYGKEIGDDRISADIAIDYFEQIEAGARDLQDSSTLAECHVNIAEAYLIKGEKKKALARLRQAEELKFSDNDLGSRRDFVSSIAGIYYDGSDYKKAADYYREMIALTDSFNVIQTAEKVSQLTESFEIGQMEDQVKQKEEQLAKNRVITYLFIGISALILILASIVFYFFRHKQKVAKLLEQRNREVEKARLRAERSEKLKERFLASMSHEIRTPLNAVIGMTGLLLEDPQPPKTETYLRNIKQAGEHLTGLINEILDLSKIDAGRLELHEAPFSLQELLEEIRGLMAGKAEEKGLQLIVHTDEGTPGWVNGDAGRIRQVLLNLAGNAIKFTEKGSVRIKLSAGGASEGKAMFRFSVEDTGPGIAKEMQAVIFEEYVQAGQIRDQRVVGTGLGLSIASKLVERMGGKMELESEPGKGSVFSFTIPLELSTEEAFQALQKEKEFSDIVMKGACRILVVEDNPSNQIVTEGMLEKILPESKPVIVEDGLKALALLEKEKFDLVLMDIRMPGIDGYETTRRLRLLQNENATIPVIALTASVIRSDIQHCLEAGMNGYVPKPVSRAILARTLHEQLKTFIDGGVAGKEPEKDNFLAGITGTPEWANRLYDLCNGKKERFIQLLTLLLEQSETETVNWTEWIEHQQHEPLAFSVHKLLPNIRIFMDEKTAAMAASLDQELREGWAEGHSADLISLKEGIFSLQLKVTELLKAINPLNTGN